MGHAHLSFFLLSKFGGGFLLSSANLLPFNPLISLSSSFFLNKMFKNLVFMGVELLYSVVLVFAVR